MGKLKFGWVLLVLLLFVLAACTMNPPSVRKAPQGQFLPWEATAAAQGGQTGSILSIATIQPTATPTGGGRGKLALLRVILSEWQFCLVEIGGTEWVCETLDISEDAQPGSDLIDPDLTPNKLEIPFIVYRGFLHNPSKRFNPKT